MEGLIVVAVIVWFVIAIIVGNFGKTRTIGFAGAFFASLFLSPILAMLFVLASEKGTPRKAWKGWKYIGYFFLIYFLLNIITTSIILVKENKEKTKESFTNTTYNPY